VNNKLKIIKKTYLLQKKKLRKKLEFARIRNWTRIRYPGSGSALNGSGSETLLESIKNISE